METSTYIALSRQMALRQQMDVIANNMANVSTPAFKQSSVVFSEYLSKPDPQTSLSYVQDYGVARDVSEGPMTPTGSSLDFAIHGDGYFTVNTPDGPRYTRRGRFQLDAISQLVTSQGYPVLSSGGGPIVIPPDDGEINVARDGTISTKGGPIARIGVVQFKNEQAMQEIAGGLFTAGEVPQPNAKAEVVQGMVEESNVRPVIELTHMMSVVRDYQAAQRMLDEEHERQRKAISTLVSSSNA